MKNLLSESLCVQAGYQPKNGQARVAPLYQSTTYSYDSADQVADLFDLKTSGHMYSRISNPSVEFLEKKLAALEGGLGGLATSSGQAASLLSVLTLARTGDNIIAFNNLYGGTMVLFKSRLKDFGIEVRFVGLDQTDQEIEDKIDERTRLIFGETLGNPSLRVLDIERYSSLAHRHGLPLVVDNTFPSPYLCRPIDHGADIVVHSTSKYIDGHATSIGGMIIDSGRFDWSQGRFACLTEPDPNYHNLSYTETFKDQAYLTKARAVYLRDLGSSMSPFNAYLTNLGAETLALRMDRHSENALAVAEFLEGHDQVAYVNYPLLKSSPDYKLAGKYLAKGGSGVVAFGIKGGAQAGKKFIDSLELLSLVVHVGDLRSYALHPASMTHRQLSQQEQEAAGIGENLIRLSIGIENIQDIIRDLDQALERSEVACPY